MEYSKKAILFSLVFLGSFILLGLNPIWAITSGALGIQPANPDPTQPFSKSRFIYTSGVGQEIKDQVDVINLADEPVRARVWAADGTTTPDGAYTIKEENTDIGTWVTFSGEEERILDLKAGETRTIDFILKVPVNAEVGDHLGAIVAQAIEMEEGLGEGEAEVESELKVVTRIGARVYLTVSGKIVRALEFPDFSLERRSPMLHFVLTLKNPGNVRIEPEGEITIKNILGATIDEVKIPNRIIFPKDEIVLPVEWEKTPIFGKFTAKASVTSEAGEVLTRKLAFWIFPPLGVPLGAGLGIITLALLIRFLVKKRRKRRRRKKGSPVVTVLGRLVTLRRSVMDVAVRVRAWFLMSLQRRKGHTQIANEIVFALMKTPLNSYETRYLWVLFWKTYGFHKRREKISNSQFSQLAGIRKGHVSRTQRRLIQRRIVTRIGNEFELNKNYEEWLDRNRVTNLGLKVTKNGNKMVAKLEDSKDRSKRGRGRKAKASVKIKRKVSKILKKSAVVILLILGFVLNSSTAQATLTISSPAAAALTGKTVSTSGQTATGTIVGVEVSDDGAAGWDATTTSTHLTIIGIVYTVVGSNNTVGTSGTYDGSYGVSDPVKRYEIVITTGGTVGTAAFEWRVCGSTCGDWTGDVTTASEVSLEKGINVTFAPATYVVDDKWRFGVDVFPYTGLYVTPSNITIVSGGTGVSKGTAGYLTGTGTTSDAKTMMVGEAGNSAGTYQQDEGLELTIHANSFSGTYAAVATFTVL